MLAEAIHLKVYLHIYYTLKIWIVIYSRSIEEKAVSLRNSLTVCPTA